jgi:SAM-dependent methyltransferase
VLGAIRKAAGLRPYSETVEDRLTGRVKHSIELIDAQPPARQYLDVGCRNGWVEWHVARRLSRNITAIDINEANVSLARRNVPEAHMLVASVLTLPFADASFDAALMFDVIEHLPARSETKALREVYRVLEPGGWFILSTPYAHPVSKALDLMWYLGHRHYSERRLRELCADAGFAVEDYHVRGGLWELGTMILHHFFKHLLHAEVPFKDTLEDQRDREYLQMGQGIGTAFMLARKPR